MAKKSGLGRGLESLMGENIKLADMSQEQKDMINYISISDIKPNPFQPRKVFEEKPLLELSESIKEHGLFQPVLLRRGIIGFEIISGERRTKAAKLAGLTSIPALIYDYDDEKMMEVAIVENIQREDLTVVEEAKSYQLILERMNMSQDQLAKKVGKSRSHITNILSLLKLEDYIIKLIEQKKLTMGHAKVLVNVEDRAVVKELVKKIVAQGLSVRDTENLVKGIKKPKTKQPKAPIVTTSDNSRIERLILDKLGLKAKIEGKDIGQVVIKFNDRDELEHLIEVMHLVDEE